MYDLEDVILDFENFCKEVGNEWCLNLAGLEDEMNLPVIYARVQN